MIVNVSAIIVHESKVLLIQRNLKDSHYAGLWGIPGGGFEEEDTSLESVAQRECLEEVGLAIEPIEIKYNNRNADAIFVVCTARLQNPSDGASKLTLSSEVHKYKWASLKDLEGLEFTPFTKSRVQEVLASLK